MSDPNDLLLLDVCKKCQECCHNIPTCICDYKILLAIKQKKIPKEIALKFVLYSIEKSYINKAALQWWHYPNENILQFMTILNENRIEILAIPKTRGDCLLAGLNGCKFPSEKPFNCQMFPLFKEMTKIREANWCPSVDLFKSQFSALRIDQIYSKYTESLKSHQEKYYNLLNELKQALPWQKVIFK